MTSISLDRGLEVAYTSSDTRNAIGESPWWKFGGHDRVFVPSGQGTSDTSLSSFRKLKEIESGNNNYDNVYSDPRAAEFYEPIEKYEGRHRFDPRASWSDEEERKLVRRVYVLKHYLSIPDCNC